MNIHPFQALIPNEEIISSPQAHFKAVKNRYGELKARGFFKQLKAPFLFIYRIEKEKKRYTGCLAEVDFNHYLNGDIRPHEATLAAREQISIERLLSRRAMIKPILLTHQPIPSLHSLYEMVEAHAPLLDVHIRETDERHTLWIVPDQEIESQIIETYHQHLPMAYIADGHHRVAALRRIHKTKGGVIQRVFSALFSFDDVDIYNFNRIIDLPSKLSPLQFLARVSKYCRIRILDKLKIPNQPFHLTMLLDGEWFELRWKKKLLHKHTDEEALPILDVDLFNRWIVGKILGIRDVRTNRHIHYIEGTADIDHWVEKVIDHPQRVGFLLHPMAFEDFRAIVNRGGMLPPKSTWFEPRMKNGLIVAPMHI